MQVFSQETYAEALLVLLRTWEHIQLTFCALFVAILIGIPIGIALQKWKRKTLSSLILRLVAVVQTVPGLALISLVLVLFVAMRSFVILPATGFLPSVVVLSIYALLPIITTTYLGIQNIDASLLDIAKTIGMHEKQTFAYVQLPLALPYIFNGIRQAFVWTIGMVTLTSLIGSGGLGDLILQGLRTMRVGLVLEGTIPAGCLAIFFDWLLQKVGNWIVPMEHIKI